MPAASKDGGQDGHPTVRLSSVAAVMGPAGLANYGSDRRTLSILQPAPAEKIVRRSSSFAEASARQVDRRYRTGERTRLACSFRRPRRKHSEGKVRNGGSAIDPSRTGMHATCARSPEETILRPYLLRRRSDRSQSGCLPLMRSRPRPHRSGRTPARRPNPTGDQRSPLAPSPGRARALARRRWRPAIASMIGPSKKQS